jgi:glycine dehydrogenase
MTFRDDFSARHIGPNSSAIASMLETIGVSSVEELISRTVPEVIRIRESLSLPSAVSEESALVELQGLASLNVVNTSMIGLGYHPTITPPVVVRNILENPAWYTAYTPYQPEISQGRLTALLNFQTMIESMTGLPIAGASLLDEPTAAAEAMTLSRRSSHSPSSTYLVDENIHPQTLAVMQVRAEPLGIKLLEINIDDVAALSADIEYFGLLISYPGSDGRVFDPTPAVDSAQARGALVTFACDLLSLCLLKSPGEYGADIAIGSAQRFGVPMGFGGPHAGFMSLRRGLERMMPGRLVGVSVDAEGATALRLALQTREQHIRREKATSNICTAQVLLAVIAGMYAAWHGPAGLRNIAERVHGHARDLAAAAVAAGARVRHSQFFDTVVVSVSSRAAEIQAALEQQGINIRLLNEDCIAIACNERTTAEHVLTIVSTLAEFTAQSGLGTPDESSVPETWEVAVSRTSAYLTHSVFSAYHSETEMLRYLRKLSDQDIALDRSMIPLGSCTMKLNSTSEMIPVTWSQWSDVHPFVPVAQSLGYTHMITQLENWLAEITGYDAVSVQPNAGSQGEFAGLLAIAAYHRSRGDDHRVVCLIPSSAHGTNAASAVMAGMRVVVVACDDEGNVDLADLRAKVQSHRDSLSALMITYPSTHGVFESAVADICELIHEAGGQVYVDGANLNALVGLAKPGQFGADVSHLNLHKTFCIPHGGGGPGVGPVGVRAHLAPFLPSHPLRADAGPVGRGWTGEGVGPISGAPWGSAGILPIPWMYIRMMGAQGLVDATTTAIVSANYIAARLSTHYPVLYSGSEGFVAHECILDLRAITKETGVTVDDIAKRLMDYGFHAPTMSFPVAGTLMVEPTESESLVEIDRFCDAMIAIRGEIDAVGAGIWTVDASPLRQAPHTALCIASEWSLPYDRMVAAFPPGVDASRKYWPPVRRIDGAYGDRNLVCSCPEPAAFADA